jgi:protein-S-isoprenylcysteine O-methyltransferase Ste14
MRGFVIRAMSGLFSQCWRMLSRGTPLMWIVAGILTVLTLVATSIEEHELGARFGAAYEDYSRQVTPFAPVDAKPREG